MSHITEIRNVRKIILILTNDICLVQSWKEFCDLLEIQPTDVLELTNSFKSTAMTYYDLFSKILHLWASRKGEKATVQMLIEILKIGNFVSVSEQLDRLVNEDTLTRQETTRKFHMRHFGVKKCISNFVGRKSELKTLTGFVESDDFLLTVTGMSGVGKSTLVLKFVNDLLTATETDDAQVRVIWFQCDDKSTLKKAIQKLAENIRIPKFPSHDKLLQKCIKSIQYGSTAKTLFVFDNVDHIHSNLIRILQFLHSISSTSPSDVKAVPILSIVTSTLLPMTKYAGTSVALDLLDEQEATQFLKSNLPMELMEDPLDLQDLAALVQYLPRKLQQAVDYIKQKNLSGIKSYGIKDYIRDLEGGSAKKRQKLLDHPLSPIERSESDRTTTFKSWRQSIRLLYSLGMEGQWAVKLHKLLSHLDSERTSMPALKKIINCATFFLIQGNQTGLFICGTLAINKNFIHVKEPKKVKLTPNADDRLDKALKLLRDHHLIRIDVTKQILSVHRMVREVTRIQISLKPSEKLYQVLRNILSEVLEHVMFNHLKNDENNNYAWDDEVGLILADVWKQALHFPDLVEKYALIGVHCTAQTSCSIQLFSTTIEEMTLIFPETNLLLLRAKINYFSRVFSSNDESDTVQDFSLLQSLVAHAAVFLGGMHSEVVRGRSLLEEAARSSSRLSQYIQIAEESLLAEDSISWPHFIDCNKITKLLNLGNAYELMQKYDIAIDYYLTAYVWTKVREDALNEDVTKISERIRHCCDQLGICVAKYFNFDDTPSWDELSCLQDRFVETQNQTCGISEVEEPPLSEPDEVRRVRSGHICHRFTKNLKHFDASKIRQIIQAMKLDMLPHR
ncbi:putative disease resistance protein RXW24L [Folsomia candida]|uniref:Putative disease resistance protein RXW24L n=1 Tax=Folsomia candida TaxID=158441 RepID=A0A226DVN7_FOLCA|nr:putative disease resistance protein RXW24L [Folsomia candida]